MEITSGRNRIRSGAAEQPAEVGQILRLIREGATAHREQQPPEAPVLVESNLRVTAKAKARPDQEEVSPSGSRTR
eukprot:7299000-Heterocapsa_arctica.AAC.1